MPVNHSLYCRFKQKFSLIFQWRILKWVLLFLMLAQILSMVWAGFKCHDGVVTKEMCSVYQYYIYFTIGRIYTYSALTIGIMIYILLHSKEIALLFMQAIDKNENWRKGYLFALGFHFYGIWWLEPIFVLFGMCLTLVVFRLILLSSLAAMADYRTIGMTWDVAMISLANPNAMGLMLIMLFFNYLFAWLVCRIRAYWLRQKLKASI